MASIAALEAQRDQVLQEIRALVTSNEERRRAIAADRLKIQSSSSPEEIGRLELNIRTLEAGIRVTQASIARLESLLAEINAEIALLRGLPAQSTGETVKQAQGARDDGATVTAPPGAPLAATADGTVTSIVSKVPSTAQPFRTALDIGLDNALRPNLGIQSYQNIADTGALLPNSSTGRPGANASNTGAAPGDDARGDNSTRSLLRDLFGDTKQLPAQPNVLDQFASYTYSISLYLMNKEQYTRQLLNKKKILSGYTLLIQSGGAPNNTTSYTPQATEVNDPGEIPGVTAFSAASGDGRNPYFGLDYYIDDVKLRSVVQGRGSRAAHNVVELNFKITEPNGITLIDNLYKAVQQYINTEPGRPVNYAAQNYLMVIRFYGYDQYGSLINPKRTLGQTTDANAILEKWIPFQFTGIQFRIANQIVEYNCTAVGVQNLASTQQRNTIPYNVELTASTLRDLLSGSASFRGGAANEQVQEGATASGLPREARGVAAPVSAVDQVAAITRAGVAQTAPPKADAAPKTNTPKTISKGLVDALNKYQDELVAEKRYEKPDRFEIIFKVPQMADAKVLPAGPIDKKKPPMIQTQDPQQAKDGARQSNDFTSQNKSILAGTTIMQFLDQVLRNSSYVTDQQLEKWNETLKKYVPNGQAIPETAWYTITMQAMPLEYDFKRHDYAYKFTYQISPYLVTDLKSQYFAASQPWVPPKRYAYWFTGQNTSVLNFTQDYNYLYYVALTGPNAPDRTVFTDYRTFDKAGSQTRSNEADQGQSGPVFEAPANAADSLYSPGDTVRAKMTIVGDPDWIQQGDLWAGVSGPVGNDSQDFNTTLPDGSLNFETREPIFEILFNKPVDYDLNTGVIDATKKNLTVIGKDGKQTTDPEISYVYRAYFVDSIFSKGKFVQDIEGAQVFFRKPSTANTDTARESSRGAAVGSPGNEQASVRRVDNAIAAQNVRATDWATGYLDKLPTGARTDSMAARLAGQSTAASTLLPAASAQAPTSNGQAVGTAAPVPLLNPPAAPGSAPALGSFSSLNTAPVTGSVFSATASSGLTDTQRAIIRLTSEQEQAQARGNFAESVRLGSEIRRLQSQLLLESPPTPVTRTQSIVKD